MATIRPIEYQSQGQQQSPSPLSQPQPPPLVYQIVASEQLPYFNPSIGIKHLFMNAETARKFSRFGIFAKPVLIPAYLLGLTLRIVAIFVSPREGEVFAVLSVLFQLPAMFFTIMAFRVEYVKVIVHTFEFYFLVLTVTIWAVCSFVYVQDVRAVLLPVVWIDFVDLGLIETYFGDSRTIFMVAIASGVYVMALTAKISLSGSAAHRVASSNQVDSLTANDAIVNAMCTMMMLVIRLAYRKYNIMKNEKEGTTWTQSIGYRCRVALSATNSSNPVTALQRAPTTKRLPMRFIKIPTLFRADNTVFPRIGTNQDLKRWQLYALSTCAGVGYTMSSFALAATSSTLVSEGVISLAAITGLSATTAFWCYCVGCCQRQLLAKLCTSFDFIFLLVQLVASHISVCDLLLWNWVMSCGIFAELLWMSWVLMLDALTPATKTWLKLKVWYGAPVLLLHFTKALVLLANVFSWHRWPIQNRLLFNQSIAGYTVQFRVFPFLFSRHVTILIWCVRILHRIKSRKTEHDLIMLLGSVEYDCHPTQLSRSIVPRIPATAVSEE